jgi:hypothetical protein
MLTATRLQSILAFLGIGETLHALARAAFRRAVIVAVLAALGAAFAVIAAAFGGWGCYMLLAQTLGPARAALSIAAGLALLAIIVLAAAWFCVAERRTRQVPVAAAAVGPGGLPFSIEEAELVLKLLKDRVGDDPLASTLISVVSGFIAGTVLNSRRR